MPGYGGVGNATNGVGLRSPVTCSWKVRAVPPPNTLSATPTLARSRNCATKRVICGHHRGLPCCHAFRVDEGWLGMPGT
jgi:hypothetical protein